MLLHDQTNILNELSNRITPKCAPLELSDHRSPMPITQEQVRAYPLDDLFTTDDNHALLEKVRIVFHHVDEISLKHSQNLTFGYTGSVICCHKYDKSCTSQ